MKKLLSFIFLVMICFSAIHAQSTMELSAALDDSAWSISSVLPASSKIAVATIFSDSQDMSAYLVQEMTRRLTQSGMFTVLERGKGTELLDAEMKYQYSGAVDDDSMVGLGKRFGAQYLVYGSFEQYGGMLQLTIQVANVESGEIPYLKSYSISKTAQITDLFGDDMELVTADDYLDAIARCQKKITAIEKDKSKAIQNQTSRLFPEYQEQINAARTLQKEPWESSSEYDARVNNAIAEIEKRRDAELSGVSDSIGINYDNQSKQVAIQRDKLIEELQNITFVLQGNSVLVMFGTFDAESIPKGWPVSVKSLDKSIAYSYNGKYAVNDADVRTEYQIVENARNNNDFYGEISYRILEGQTKDTFNLYVVSVRVYIMSSGLAIMNENIDKVVGQVVASQVVPGTATPTGTQRVVQTNPSAVVMGNTSTGYYGGETGYYGGNGVVYVPAESTKPVWVTNNFSVGASVVVFPAVSIPVSSSVDNIVELHTRAFLGGLGIALSAFNTTKGCFYVDWLNVDICFNPGDVKAFYFDASVDAGAYLNVFRYFFPFIKVGAGLFYATNDRCSVHKNNGSSLSNSYVSVSGTDFFIKGGVGFDIKGGGNFKINLTADFRYGITTKAMGLGIKLGVAFGKPVE